MTPTIAPSIRFLLMAYQIRYTFLMSHSLKMAPPNQSTHKADKLINSRGYSPLLHTKLYLNVADEIISLILSHSSILFTIDIQNLSLLAEIISFSLITSHIVFVNGHQCFDRRPWQILQIISFYFLWISQFRIEFVHHA